MHSYDKEQQTPDRCLYLVFAKKLVLKQVGYSWSKTQELEWRISVSMDADCFLEEYFMFPVTAWQGVTWAFQLIDPSSLWMPREVSRCCQIDRFTIRTEKQQDLNLLLLFWPLKVIIHTCPHVPSKVFFYYTFKYTLTNSKYKCIMWLSVLTCIWKNAKVSDATWRDLAMTGNVFLVTCKYQYSATSSYQNLRLKQNFLKTYDSHI